MTTEQLTKGKKIVAKARLLTKDIATLEATTSTKCILVLSDGHNFSVFVQDTEADITGDIHRLIIDRMKHERADLHKQFEDL